MSFKGATLTVALCVALVAVLALPARRAPPKPWQVDYYRTRVKAGAQCHYANGSRAILLRTYDQRKMALTVSSWMSDEPMIELNIDRAGDFHYEANGGVTTYHSIDLAVEYLRTLPTTPVTASTFDAFLAKTGVPACNRPAFYVDLYTDAPLE